MKKRYTVKNYMLIEYLIVGAMVVMVMTAVIMFFNSTSKLYRNITEDTYNNQHILLLKNRWRNFIHSASDNFIISNNGSKISSGNSSAEFKEHHLTITENGKQKVSIKLSKKAAIKFSIEKTAEQKIMVMNILLPSPTAKNNTEQIRIVACKEK